MCDVLCMRHVCNVDVWMYCACSHTCAFVFNIFVWLVGVCEACQSSVCMLWLWSEPRMLRDKRPQPPTIHFCIPPLSTYHRSTPPSLFITHQPRAKREGSPPLLPSPLSCINFGKRGELTKFIASGSALDHVAKRTPTHNSWGRRWETRPSHIRTSQKGQTRSFKLPSHNVCLFGLPRWHSTNISPRQVAPVSEQNLQDSDVYLSGV